MQDSYDGYPTYDTAYAATKDGQNIDLFKDSNGYYKERYALEARTVENDDGTTSTVVCYQTEDQQGTDDYNVVNDVTYNKETKKFTYKNQEGNDVEVDALYADPSENLISESYKNYLTKQADGSFVSEGGTSYDVTKSSKALNFEGTTTAQRELYDYAVAITEAYYNDKVSGTSQNLKYDKEMVNYYKNIFNEMRASGFTTTQNETNLKEYDWFVKQLKAGNLVLSYYSTSEKSFINTTLDDDSSITEKEDKSAMAIAEQEYQTRMDKLESQDKQFDLQLNKLESEHNALQTEYDSVKKVISNNVEKSFSIFNA